MRKRTIATLLACTMVLGTITGCSSEPKNPGDSDTEAVQVSTEAATTKITYRIENKQQSEFLCNHGCDYLQGYYLGIPSKTPTKLALSVSEMIQDVNCGKTTE